MYLKMPERIRRGGELLPPNFEGLVQEFCVRGVPSVLGGGFIRDLPLRFYAKLKKSNNS